MSRTRAGLTMGALLALAVSLRSEEAAGLQMVVNASIAVSSLPRNTVADMFLGKVKAWEDGRKVLIVDQSLYSPVRARFTKEVLGRPVSAVKTYWEERVFSGREQPPPVKRSDAEVVEFVVKNPGAIGYVSAGANLIPGVKVVTLN